MARQSIITQVEAMALPIARRFGLEVAGVDLLGQGPRTILRVTVEESEGGRGLGVDELARVSEALSRQLDLHDLIPHAYTLEVSSPGLDRPLRADGDFQRFAGRAVEIWTAAPVEGQRHFKGTLSGLEGGSVRLTMDGRLVSLPREQVTRARLVVDEEMVKKDLAGGGRATS